MGSINYVDEDVGPTTKLLAIDPGASTGWAKFVRRELVACGRTDVEGFDALQDLTLDGAAVVIECPRVYPMGKVDPNDLIQLARKVGRLEALLPPWTEIVYPATWKGQLTKAQCHARWLPRLTPAEAGCLAAGLLGVPKSAQHDVRDAVCLGLWRLERKG